LFGPGKGTGGGNATGGASSGGGGTGGASSGGQGGAGGASATGGVSAGGTVAGGGAGNAAGAGGVPPAGGTGGVGGAVGGSGGTTSEPCCTVHAAPGCADEGVRNCVCNEDPYCCDTGWDQQCVDNVDYLSCGNCNSGTGGFGGGGFGGSGGGTSCGKAGQGCGAQSDCCTTFYCVEYNQSANYHTCAQCIGNSNSCYSDYQCCSGHCSFGFPGTCY
jgi:hypothetical protein